MTVNDFGENLSEPNSDMKLIYGISFLLSVFLGCLGNIIAIVIVTKVLRSRQTVPNVLILVLACTDLLTITFGFVPALLNYFSGVNIAHATLCNFQGSVLNFLYLKSIILVSCLSFDRFMALYTPFFYKIHVVFDCKKIALVLVVFSIIAMVVTLLPMLGLGKYVLHYPGTFCMFHFNPKDVGGKITLNTNLACLMLCTIIVVACNSAVSWRSFKMLRRSTEQRPNVNEGDSEAGSSLTVCSTDECQFLKLSLIAMTSFLCCWTVFMIRVIMIQAGSTMSSCWDMIAVRLVSFHTVGNPWIYLLTRRLYRKGFWYIIRITVYYITCKKLCMREKSLDDILGLKATKVVHFGKDEKKTDSEETLFSSRSGFVKKK